jgi:peptide/nickel transport system permease protein
LLLAARNNGGGDGLIRYILFRLLNAAIIVVVVFVLVFLLTHWVANPVDQLLPLSATAAERAAMAHKIGTDQPIMVQMFDYMKAALHGDLGESWYQDRPVMDIVLERLPTTMQLVGAAFGIAMVFGLVFGVLASLWPRSIFDKLISTSSLVGICLPNFWAGLILIIIFAVHLRWFPSSGVGNWKNLVLPAMTLALLPLGRMVEIVRSGMLDQMREQYVTTARAKGVSEWLVVAKHALKNTGVTVVTMGGWELGRMIAGYTVVVEVVFAWPGMGHLVVEAIKQGDFALVQALALVIAVMIGLLNLLVDLSYPLFDPRIKYGS